MDITQCAITGFPLKPNELKPTLSSAIEYETEVVGKVKIGIGTYQELLKGEYERYLIAGICKQRTIDGLEPLMIDLDFISSRYKNENPPLEFEEKCFALLKNLYFLGGKINKDIVLNSTKDFALGYASPEEFCRIIDQLKSDHSITIKDISRMGRGDDCKYYTGVKFTTSGVNLVKKVLPKMPMFGLVTQTITTGNIDIDQKINHARDLFLSEPQNKDNMRSACEALSYVLEPLRNDLTSYFSEKDVSDFFQLVNRFDVRHNKDTTTALQHPEQLEWIFYTLLNTINTYTKIKSKGIL